MKNDIKQTYLSQIQTLPKDISRLENIGETVHFKKNQIVINAGDIPKYCYLIKEGRVAGYEYTLNGHVRTYNYNEKNSILLDAPMFLNMPSPVTFKALVNTTAIQIKREKVITTILNNPEVSLDFIFSLSLKFMSSMEQVRHTTIYNVDWKVCDLLIKFANMYGVIYDSKILIKEKISQQSISDLLGINRFTTVKVLKTLKELELVEIINGYYCIRDMDKLIKYKENLLISSRR